MVRLIIIAILSLFLSCGSEGSGVTPPHEYRQECVVWDNVTSMLEREPLMELSCLKNAQCTGFDCAGNYTYKGLFTMFQRHVVGTCFGVTIHPCHMPVDMQLYVDWPDQETTFRHTSLNDEVVKVKGGSFDTIAGGKATAFIDVHMRHITVNKQPFLRIGLKLKICLTLHGFETCPAPLAVQLMRDAEIPVPRCDKSVITPPHKSAICNANVRGRPQGSADEVEPKGLGKSCITTKMYTCQSGEKCLVQNNNVHGYCVCLNGYSRRLDSDHCMPTSTTAVPAFMQYITTKSKKKAASKDITTKSKKKAASKELVIVLCSCVAGIAVIGIVVLLVILRLRKQRARYAQHERLLNNDDDDDDPLDAAI